MLNSPKQSQKKWRYGNGKENLDQNVVNQTVDAISEILTNPSVF